MSVALDVTQTRQLQPALLLDTQSSTSSPTLTARLSSEESSLPQLFAPLARPASTTQSAMAIQVAHLPPELTVAQSKLVLSTSEAQLDAKVDILMDMLASRTSSIGSEQTLSCNLV